MDFSKRKQEIRRDNQGIYRKNQKDGTKSNARQMGHISKKQKIQIIYKMTNLD